MCSIFQLLPGYTLPYDLLFNAVHNNEHGYGILLKANGKIQVIKDMPKQVDPEKIYKILKDNEDVERWVHLRNASQGEVHKDNVQPIQVYHSNKRDVYFMHNGTMYNILVPENQKNFLSEPLDEKHSDSKKYAIAKIAPLLLRIKGDKGSADLEDPFLQEILTRNWSTSNGRAVLISSDQPPFLLHSAGWESIKDETGELFLASNDDYFKEIKRGTLYDKRRAEEEAKKPKYSLVPSLVANKNSKEIHVLEYPPFELTVSLSEDIVNILEEYDLYSPEGFIAMANIEESELVKLFKDHLPDAVTMFMYLCSYLKDATVANEKLLEQIEVISEPLKPIQKTPTSEREIHVG